MRGPHWSASSTRWTGCAARSSPIRAARRRISDTLLGAAADRRHAEALMHGRLTEELHAPGFDALTGATRLRVVQGGTPRRDAGAMKAHDERRRSAAEARQLERDAKTREREAKARERQREAAERRQKASERAAEVAALERDAAVARERLAEVERRLKQVRRAKSRRTR